MNKYSGMVGLSIDTEDRPGIWKPQIVEKFAYGDIIRDNRNNVSADQANDNIKINNQISIVANPFLMENFRSIVYITYAGAKWRISTVEVKYPRLLLSMGEVYNVQDTSGISGVSD